MVTTHCSFSDIMGRENKTKEEKDGKNVENLCGKEVSQPKFAEQIIQKYRLLLTRLLDTRKSPQLWL